jgi:septum formation protein
MIETQPAKNHGKQAMDEPSQELVLASGSRFRRRMLEAAGVPISVSPSDVDEHALREGILKENKWVDPASIALRLAAAKALSVAAIKREAIVIGCDQILSLGDRIFSKPASLDEARNHLATLQGKTHRLHTAVALAQGERVTWQHMATALMSMRHLSRDDIERYIATAGPTICETVGAYEFEGLGVQLFESVDGDQFTIVGLPLLPLIKQLRRRGIRMP